MIVQTMEDSCGNLVAVACSDVYGRMHVREATQHEERDHEEQKRRCMPSCQHDHRDRSVEGTHCAELLS